MAISLLEAMSFGNCCLVSDIPENTEVIEECGLSFEKSNVDDLKQKLEYILENPEKVYRLQKNSIDFVCQKYNWDNVVEKTEFYYNKSHK